MGQFALWSCIAHEAHCSPQVVVFPHVVLPNATLIHCHTYYLSNPNAHMSIQRTRPSLQFNESFGLYPAGKKKKKGSKDGSKTDSDHKGATKSSDGKASKSSSGGSTSVINTVNTMDPATAAITALCSATGTLNHLSFLDDAKIQICEQKGAQCLVPLLSTSNPQVGKVAFG